ncbi:hypothetical protein RHGRI_036963 [Rhododendron griersonianum]|uniref:FAR1 domain-containing protein n=1 Tax=Rhododendron griersonianum TaxID=479676 RepID=A0AAV6HPX9_9ERIC|nr:hypothetical protein RHGRI_036963 [Rhododendron griersonianum]
METSIASSPSIDKQDIVDLSLYYDVELKYHTMDDVELEDHTMEVEKQVTSIDVVITKQKPQQEVFSSDEELVDWIRCTGHLRRRLMGKEVVVKKRVRSTGTKKCECPFELKVVKGNDGWIISVHNGTHNHPPTMYLEGHSYAGRLSSKQTATVVDLSVSLVKTKEILTHLKVQDPQNVTTMETVYNVRQKNRVIEKAGRSYMQHLLGRLEEYKYVHWTRANEAGNVTELFWSPHLLGRCYVLFPEC